MKNSAKGIGLAIIGAGRVGLFRGEVAKRHPAVEWIGIAELNHNRVGLPEPELTQKLRPFFAELKSRKDAYSKMQSAMRLQQPASQ